MRRELPPAEWKVVEAHLVHALCIACLGHRLPSFQQLEKRLSRPGDAALDRTDGAAADLRRLFVREAAHAHEDERSPLPRRQRGERAIEVTQLELAVMIGRH